MTPPDAADNRALQRLLAEAGVARNLATYAASLDRSDHELLRSCFTEDVVATYSGGNACTGVDQIVSYVTAALEPFSATQHEMGSSRLLNMKSDECSAETYCVAYLFDRRSSMLWTRGLRYLDRLIESDGDWKVAERDQIGEWMTSTPAMAADARWPGSVASKEDHGW